MRSDLVLEDLAAWIARHGKPNAVRPAQKAGMLHNDKRRGTSLSSPSNGGVLKLNNLGG